MMRYSAIGIYSTGKILLDGVIASPVTAVCEFRPY